MLVEDRASEPLRVVVLVLRDSLGLQIGDPDEKTIQSLVDLLEQDCDLRAIWAFTFIFIYGCVVYSLHTPPKTPSVVILRVRGSQETPY